VLKKSVRGLFQLETRKAWFSSASEFMPFCKNHKVAAPFMARGSIINHPQTRKGANGAGGGWQYRPYWDADLGAGSACRFSSTAG